MANIYVNMELKERIKGFCDSMSLSIREFERQCGLSRGNISNMSGALGSDKLAKIIDAFPDLNITWLLTGNGVMLHEHTVPIPIVRALDQDAGTPYYDVDFCGGFEMFFNDQTTIPAGYINIPQYNKADSWANITGHSMEPLIGHGDMIALKKVEDWRTYMLYGEIYGIMTNEWRTVKRVRKAENPDSIILEPINKDYDKWEIPKDIITGVWQVLGCAKKLF